MLPPDGGGELGDFPEHLEESLRGPWYEIVARVPEGVLQDSDALIVETAARLLAWTRQTDCKLGVYSALIQALSKLGCTPLDRRRVPAAPAKRDDPNDPWAKFLPKKADGVVAALFGEKRTDGRVRARLQAKMRQAGGFAPLPGDAELLESNTTISETEANEHNGASDPDGNTE